MSENDNASLPDAGGAGVDKALRDLVGFFDDNCDDSELDGVFNPPTARALLMALTAARAVLSRLAPKPIETGIAPPAWCQTCGANSPSNKWHIGGRFYRPERMSDSPDWQECANPFHDSRPSREGRG